MSLNCCSKNVICFLRISKCQQKCHVALLSIIWFTTSCTAIFLSLMGSNNFVFNCKILGPSSLIKDVSFFSKMKSSPWSVMEFWMIHEKIHLHQDYIKKQWSAYSICTGTCLIKFINHSSHQQNWPVMSSKWEFTVSHLLGITIEN